MDNLLCTNLQVFHLLLRKNIKLIKDTKNKDTFHFLLTQEGNSAKGMRRVTQISMSEAYLGSHDLQFHWLNLLMVEIKNFASEF